MAGRPPKLPNERRKPNRVPTLGEWTALETTNRSVPYLPKRDPAWSAASRARWRAWWRSPMAGQWLETDKALLVRLLGLIEEREYVAPIVAKTRLVKGSTGQLRPNPLIGYLANLEGQISNLEDKLGLSPRGRQQLRWAVEESETVERTTPKDELEDRRSRRDRLREAFEAGG